VCTLAMPVRMFQAPPLTTLQALAAEPRIGPGESSVCVEAHSQRYANVRHISRLLPLFRERRLRLRLWSVRVEPCEARGWTCQSRDDIELQTDQTDESD
jgi:hypothetical protein